MIRKGKSQDTESDSEFQKIHDDFRPRILRYLKRLVGEYEAEDLTQEVFIKINNSLESFRGESRISTWIYKIATNAALDRLRSSSFKQNPHKKSVHDTSLIQIDFEHKDIKTGNKPALPDAELIRNEMNDCIRDFIEKLPAEYRIVIVLSELEGLKNIQIADTLGVTLDTVKIRLHRARARLRKELQNNCSFYRDEQNELACDLKTVLKGLANEK